MNNFLRYKGELIGHGFGLIEEVYIGCGKGQRAGVASMLKIEGISLVGGVGLEKNWWIEEKLFSKIRKALPIAAVDILAVYEGRLLLMLRNNEPIKDVWFTPVGRVRFGESLEQACLRKLGEETGLEAVKLEKKGVMGHLYPDCHYILTFFRVVVKDDKVVMNDEHRDFGWISEVTEDIHPYVKHMIREAGIFKNV